MTSFLELKDVHLSYDRAEALKGISLRVDEGSIVTLLGANGVIFEKRQERDPEKSGARVLQFPEVKRKAAAESR